MYRIKTNLVSFMLKYAWTKLDIVNGVYNKETWNSAGFKDSVLVEVK
jgi:hypothetical protein